MMVIFDLKDFRVNVLKETPEEIASRLGVTPDYVTRLEKLPRFIPIELLCKLADSAGMAFEANITIH